MPHYLACRHIYRTSIVLINVLLLIKLQGNPICGQIGFKRSLFAGKLGLCSSPTVFVSFAPARLVATPQIVCNASDQLSRENFLHRICCCLVEIPRGCKDIACVDCEDGFFAWPYRSYYGTKCRRNCPYGYEKNTETNSCDGMLIFSYLLKETLIRLHVYSQACN